jgi:hypothetical protein
MEYAKLIAELKNLEKRMNKDPLKILSVTMSVQYPSYEMETCIHVHGLEELKKLAKDYNVPVDVYYNVYNNLDRYEIKVEGILLLCLEEKGKSNGV